MLLFIRFRSSCSRSFSPSFFPSSCNFLSPSDVFARTRENHVKPRFKAVIYVNETLTTSTKFYSPELTLGPPRHTPRVSYSSYFFLCLYLVTSLDTKETKKKREKEEEEEEQEERMARKLFFPTTERSLRNDRVLKLHSLMISPPYPNLFLWPLTKINSPPPPSCLVLASLSSSLSTTRPLNFSQAFNTGNNLILERKRDPIPYIYNSLRLPFDLPQVHPLEACTSEHYTSRAFLGLLVPLPLTTLKSGASISTIYFRGLIPFP